MGTAGEAIQARIAASEAYDAIVYGQRAVEAMGGRDIGMSAEYGAPAWAVAQYEAGLIEAAIAIGADDIDLDAITAPYGGGSAWLFKRAKKVALEAKREAQAAVKAIGNQRQLRLALAA